MNKQIALGLVETKEISTRHQTYYYNFKSIVLNQNSLFLIASYDTWVFFSRSFCARLEQNRHSVLREILFLIFSIQNDNSKLFFVEVRRIKFCVINYKI